MLDKAVLEQLVRRGAAAKEVSETKTMHDSASLSDAIAAIQRFAAELAGIAKYGYRGEKPLALRAMLQARLESGIIDRKASEFLDEHRDLIKRHFIEIAGKYGSIKSARESWSVITSVKVGARDAAGDTLLSWGGLRVQETDGK